MAMTGLLKGVVGIAVRPAVGIFELINKGTHGMGLVCLGREAITGSAQRRVRAPGALADEQPEVGHPVSLSCDIHCQLLCFCNQFLLTGYPEAYQVQSTLLPEFSQNYALKQCMRDARNLQH